MPFELNATRQSLPIMLDIGPLRTRHCSHSIVSESLGRDSSSRAHYRARAPTIANARDNRGKARLNHHFPGEFPEIPEGGAPWEFAIQ